MKCIICSQFSYFETWNEDQTQKTKWNEEEKEFLMNNFG